MRKFVMRIVKAIKIAVLNRKIISWFIDAIIIPPIEIMKICGIIAKGLAKSSDTSIIGLNAKARMLIAVPTRINPIPIAKSMMKTENDLSIKRENIRAIMII